MNCRKAERRLAGYLDGAISSRERHNLSGSIWIRARLAAKSLSATADSPDTWRTLSLSRSQVTLL